MKTTGHPLRCLIVEDMEDDAMLVLRELRAHGYVVTAERVDTPEAMRAALERATWDLIVSDYTMPRFSGLEALKLLQARGSDLPFILVSGAMGEEVAVNAMRAGVHDYLLKNDLRRLGPAVKRELAHAADRRARRQAEAAARESSALLVAAGKMANLGGWSVDLSNNTVYWSDEVARIHDEAPGFSPPLTDAINYYAPKWRDRITEVFTACAREGTPYDEELEIITARGRRVWVRTNGQAVRDEAGRIHQVHGAFQDISKRKNLEQIDHFLAEVGVSPERESFFPSLARFLAKILQMDYICIDRLEGDMLNATTLAVWHDGEFEDNVTYALKDTPCGEVVSNKVCCYPAHVSRNFPNDAALQQLRAESYVGVTLFSHTGQPIGLIAVIGRQSLANRAFAEGTLARVAPRAAGELERMMVEAQVQQSEERYRLITESASDLIWLYNLKTAHFDYISPSVERLLGYTREEVQAADLTTVLTPASAVLARTTLGRRIAALARGDRSEIQHRDSYEHVRKDGSIMIGEVTSTALLDQAGQPVKILGVARDITERKRSEEAIVQQLDELRRWQEVMLDREDRVQELKQEVNELAARLGLPLPYPSQAAGVAK